MIAARAEMDALFTPWWRVLAREDRARAIFIVTWLLSAAYLASWIAHGWIPHDDGLLAQSAERLLRGQLPHRDFDEMYTGGLTALHAAAFAVLGTRLITLRLILLAASVVWVPVVYAVARRFATPAVAGLATLAAVVWSVPNYGAAMPSWYNLFFATAGLLALLKYAETRRMRWLFLAGMCGGLSVLIKIVGLYFLAGAGLFVIYCAYDRITDSDKQPPRHVVTPQSAPFSAGDRRVGLAIALISTLLVLGAIAALLRPATAVVPYFYFMLPTAATCVAIIVRASDADGFSWHQCWRGVGSLVLGFGVVVAPFLAVYARAHALGPLYLGVLVLPSRRYTFAMGIPTWPGPIPIAVAATILVTLPIRPRLAGALIGALSLASLAHFWSPQLRQFWDPRLVEAARATQTILACAFAAIVVWKRRDLDTTRRIQVFGVLVVASLWSLVEYPFFGLIYFFYCAPLVVLAAVALFGAFGQPGGKLSASAALVFFTVFAIHRMPPRSGGLMAIARGGIFVGPADSAEAEGLVDLLRAHARNGYTFATPDCPEVYFLSGLANPTRTMFDFFTDTAGRSDRLLNMLATRRVTAVTINRQPLFSGPPNTQLTMALATRYPDSAISGRYVVRWQSDHSIPMATRPISSALRGIPAAHHAPPASAGLR